MTSLPVDLAPMPPELRQTRWVVFWPVDGAHSMYNEALFGDEALALAYAAAKRGVLVGFVNIDPMPEGVR